MNLNLNNISYTTIAYSLITLTFASHAINKGLIDFVMLATLHVSLAIIYYQQYKSENFDNIFKKKYDFPSEKEMTKAISILYIICALIYAKHCFHQSDYDYLLLFIAMLVLSIVKYNKIRGLFNKALSMNEWMNILSLLGISIVMGKHAIINENMDYILITGLFAIHTLSDYKSYN